MLVSTRAGKEKWVRVGVRLAFRLERCDLAVARPGSILCQFAYFVETFRARLAATEPTHPR
jgi:hypothetical protein